MATVTFSTRGQSEGQQEEMFSSTTHSGAHIATQTDLSQETVSEDKAILIRKFYSKLILKNKPIKININLE